MHDRITRPTRRLAAHATRLLSMAVTLTAALTLSGTSQRALAAWPDHPIRLVIPSVPGGGTDTSSRIIATRLGEVLGQPVVADNRGGASGNIGADIVAHAPADGYTLLAMIASHASNVSLMKQVPYDLMRDFAPISQTVTLPNMLVAHPSLPVKSLVELIEYARAHPDELQFGTAGIGANQHLAMELFLSTAGLRMVHVPYKGIGPALTDTVGGRIPLMIGNMLVVLPHVRNGRLRALGVTSGKRAEAAPDIPTIAEGGLPGYDAVQWYGLVAPAGTPTEIIGKLHAAVVRVLREPAVRARFAADGAEATPSPSPEAFGQLIRDEIAKWAAVVKAAGIRAD
jgi:tripartite-type tricarboxylate transporter receptor subunit TctC